MRTGQRVALLGMLVSGALAVAKLLAGIAGHSIAVIADGLESGGDVFASGLVFLGLTLAAKPADSDHPYGHGRVETLTGLLVGLMLVGAGAGISFHALMLVGEPQSTPALYAIWPLIASIAIKGVLSVTKYRVGKAIGSSALAADAWNDK